MRRQTQKGNRGLMGALKRETLAGQTLGELFAISMVLGLAGNGMNY